MPEAPVSYRTHKAIAVLGMHRSGTSCLTGLLEDAGVWLGDVSKRNPYNLKGNQENLRIMHLHDAVLLDNGASWDAPPRGNCSWSESRLLELREIIASYPNDRPWAFKDPRACFTISGWLQLVPELSFVGTFRHPAAVAASLISRDPTTTYRRCEQLWCAYNRQLLALRGQRAFPLICFDLSPEEYLASVARAFARLGQELTSTTDGFFDPSLRRQASTPHQQAPGDEAMAIYGELRSAAE